MPIRFLTAGESHGKLLNAIIEGIPSGLKISSSDINHHLARRQAGYGRGDRMKIETDSVEINSGIRHGITIGSPISLIIRNKDWNNWETVMSPEYIDPKDIETTEKIQNKKIEHVRPAHADFAGAIKYNHTDIRNVLERSSARETATRVAVGAICINFLNLFGIDIFSHVIAIGNTKINSKITKDLSYIKHNVEKSILRTIDSNAEKQMISEIDKAKEQGDTLGGIVQVIATGLPVGLGSYVHWDKRLDGQIAQSIMSIQAIKCVEIGLGKDVSHLSGSEVHDEIFIGNDGAYFRKTNNAGGIEGGMSNGEPIIINAVMKPIPTLKKPLNSINLYTREKHIAHYERSDVCAVPSVGVICESMLAITLMNAFLEKFGSDSIDEILTNYNAYLEAMRLNK